MDKDRLKIPEGIVIEGNFRKPFTPNEVLIPLEIEEIPDSEADRLQQYINFVDKERSSGNPHAGGFGTCVIKGKLIPYKVSIRE